MLLFLFFLCSHNNPKPSAVCDVRGRCLGGRGEGSVCQAQEGGESRAAATPLRDVLHPQRCLQPDGDVCETCREESSTSEISSPDCSSLLQEVGEGDRETSGGRGATSKVMETGFISLTFQQHSLSLPPSPPPPPPLSLSSS